MQGRRTPALLLGAPWCWGNAKGKQSSILEELAPAHSPDPLGALPASVAAWMGLTNTVFSLFLKGYIDFQNFLGCVNVFGEGRVLF